MSEERADGQSRPQIVHARFAGSGRPMAVAFDGPPEQPIQEIEKAKSAKKASGAKKTKKTERRAAQAKAAEQTAPPAKAAEQPAVQAQTAEQPAASSTPRSDEKRVKRGRILKRLMHFAIAAVVVGGGVAAWWVLSQPSLPPGFAGGNGRLEATEIYVATKYAGRINEILFSEGDTVEAGQVVARMDTSALDAQLRQAVADITAAQDARNVALAQVQVKQADYDFAKQQYERSKQLVTQGAVSGQEAEVDAARMAAGRAELLGAQSQAVRTLSTINAARATADRIRADINDSVLVAPLRTRVQTRLAEPGEVLTEGGRVLSLVDLSDVYMYVFLPETDTGKIPLGSEARIILDAAPQYPIRATVSFISPTAQFTPKTVETAEERYNLTFRVKLQLDKERLREFEPLVKSGLPGMGYVRYDANAQWPEHLQYKAVTPETLWSPLVSGGPN